MEELVEWIKSVVGRDFREKFEVDPILLLIEDSSKNLSTFCSEIQQAINTFNEEKYYHQGSDLFINAQHLRSIFEHDLPPYLEVLTQLRTDAELYQKVVNELTGSSYFREVYEIKAAESLLINLLILFYRTSLLYLYPNLREREGQISSTLEEMACFLALSGEITCLYLATKHWVGNWEEEEFSPVLVEKLREAKLL